MSKALTQKKIGVLMSGGLDSTALIAHFIKKGFEISPIYVQCGLRWEETEIYWAKKFLSAVNSKKLKPLKIVKLHLDDAYHANWSQTGKIPGTHSADSAVFLPARNILLITKSLLSLSFSHVFRIAIGTLKGNPFPDGRPTYFKSLEKTLSLSFIHPIKIEIPFREWTKTYLIKTYASYPLHLSISCINPQKTQHCGQCNKCAERKKAFKKAGVIDETFYARG